MTELTTSSTETAADTLADHAARKQVIQTYWDALMSGDMATFRGLLAPDCVIHYPGQNYMSGDYTTTDSIVGLYTQLTQFVQDGVFVGKVLDITCGDLFTTVVLTYDINLPLKKVFRGRATGLFLLNEDYKIKECWLHEWNQVAINRIFRATWASKPLMPLVTRIKKRT